MMMVEVVVIAGCDDFKKKTCLHEGMLSVLKMNLFEQTWYDTGNNI